MRHLQELRCLPVGALTVTSHAQSQPADTRFAGRQSPADAACSGQCRASRRSYLQPAAARVALCSAFAGRFAGGQASTVRGRLPVTNPRETDSCSMTQAWAARRRFSVW